MRRDLRSTGTAALADTDRRRREPPLSLMQVWAAKTALAQGFANKISDPSVVRDVAALLRGANADAVRMRPPDSRPRASNPHKHVRAASPPERTTREASDDGAVPGHDRNAAGPLSPIGLGAIVAAGTV
jgi:hypothetical protein